MNEFSGHHHRGFDFSGTFGPFKIDTKIIISVVGVGGGSASAMVVLLRVGVVSDGRSRARRSSCQRLTEEFNKNADPVLFVATQLEWFVFNVVFARLVEWQNEKESTANLAVGPQQ